MPVNEDLISYLINYLLYQPCPIFSRIMVFSRPVLYFLLQCQCRCQCQCQSVFLSMFLR